jgi:predicted acylesterase/phospholipase RssA
MKTLVFSGSGALYPAHLGAAAAYYEIKGKPDRLLGISGGALIASVLSAGGRPENYLDFILDTLPKKVIGLNWKGFFRRHWGPGSLDKLEEALKQKAPRIFADCKIELNIVCTDLDNNVPKVYNSLLTPKEQVPNIACASASIPGIFAPREDMNGNLLVDGGLCGTLWVDEFSRGDVTGILLKGRSNGPKKVRTLLDFVESNIGTALAHIDNEHIEDAFWANIITVDVDWNGLEFAKMDKEAVMKMYKKGYETVKAKLKSQ